MYHHNILDLCLQESDKQLLFEIVKMKLSESAVELLKTGTSTNRCESVNRSISVSLPKNNDFGRNAEGRLASTIHRLNNGVADSAERKLNEVGVNLSEDTRHSLRQMQREKEYQKEYSKRPDTVKHSLLSKGRALREHLEYRKTNSARSDYKKGQLDPSGPSTSTAKGSNTDHSY